MENIALQSQTSDLRTILQNIQGSTILQDAANVVKAPVEWLRSYYSSVCGKTLTMAQTLLLVNTQLAFLFTAMPASMPIVARLAGLAWLILSLKKCKDSI